MPRKSCKMDLQRGGVERSGFFFGVSRKQVLLRENAWGSISPYNLLYMLIARHNFRKQVHCSSGICVPHGLLYQKFGGNSSQTRKQKAVHGLLWTLKCTNAWLEVSLCTKTIQHIFAESTDGIEALNLSSSNLSLVLHQNDRLVK